MKKVLIISPHFPPVNAPDMQRIRMNLPYFKQNGWQPVVLSVHEDYVDGYLDPDLCQAIPEDVEIIKVSAFNSAVTNLVGVKNVALRSLYFMFKKGNELLKNEKFDLIFFSTSNFYACILGSVWKSKFKVPFIIDFQDPWYNAINTHMRSRLPVLPDKHTISQMVHRLIESKVVPVADGIIAVSSAYIEDVHRRYPDLIKKPAEVINFGSSHYDFNLIRNNGNTRSFPLSKNKINVVYTGALTSKFIPVIRSFFKVFLNRCANQNDYRFYFIGTSYFKGEKGMLNDLIDEMDLKDVIEEHPDRLTYFSTLSTMMSADIVFLPGSMDGDYNPSKITNVIHSKTPVFAIFNRKSIVHDLIASSEAGVSVPFDDNISEDELYSLINSGFTDFLFLHKKSKKINKDGLISNYSSDKLTEQLCKFFDQTITNYYD